MLRLRRRSRGASWSSSVAAWRLGWSSISQTGRRLPGPRRRLSSSVGDRLLGGEIEDFLCFYEGGCFDPSKLGMVL